VKGTFDGADFTYTSDLDVQQELKFEQPVVVEAGKPASVTIKLDLDGWFRNGGGTLLDPATAATGAENESFGARQYRPVVPRFPGRRRGRDGRRARGSRRRALIRIRVLLDEGGDFRRSRCRPSRVQRDRPLAGGARSRNITDRLQGGTQISLDLGQRVSASLPPRELGCPAEARRRAGACRPAPRTRLEPPHLR